MWQCRADKAQRVRRFCFFLTAEFRKVNRKVSQRYILKLCATLRLINRRVLTSKISVILGEIPVRLRDIILKKLFKDRTTDAQVRGQGSGVRSQGASVPPAQAAASASQFSILNSQFSDELTLCDSEISDRKTSLNSRFPSHAV
ncbi:MAG: hypothetical protein BWK80_26140 [Desulfobacteraceae bacterium IS3]|nr:MAG: hypothetical protein BWK80_26140 [Desulfobacteraceae bacterium IS3]